MRNFNQTQHVYSEEKVYPGGRAHTIDPVDFDGLHQGMSEMSPSPNKARNTHTNQFATEDSTTQAHTRTNAYQSAQKIRLAKKQSLVPEHHGMSATIHTGTDNE